MTTSYVKWSPSYAIGDKIIDDQHEKLFNVINLLRNNLLNLDGNRKNKHQVVEKSFKDLLEYISKHFAYEESILKTNCPETIYLRHKKIHKAIVRKLHQLKAEFDSGDKAAGTNLFGFLVSDWLVNHILGEDAKLKDYLKK